MNENAWISNLLQYTAFLITKRLRELSWRLKSWLSYFGGFCYLNSPYIRKSIILIFMSSSRDEFALSYQNLVTDVSVGFRPPCWCPSEGDQHGDSIQSFINLSKTFLEYLAYGNVFISQIVNFINWTRSIFIFDSATVKTSSLFRFTDANGCWKKTTTIFSRLNVGSKLLIFK